MQTKIIISPAVSFAGDAQRFHTQKLGGSAGGDRSSTKRGHGSDKGVPSVLIISMQVNRYWIQIHERCL